MRHAYALRGSLTVVAVLLGLSLLERLTNGPAPGAGLSALVSPSSASAHAGPGPDEGAGLVSAAEQRKQIITELRRLSQQLEAMDARLKAGLSVKVTDMPEIKVPAGEPPKDNP